MAKKKFFKVLELTLYDDIYLVMGVRDNTGEAGEPWVNR
jgi:hypothetical protein